MGKNTKALPVYLRDKARIPSGQESSILPARVANHSAVRTKLIQALKYRSVKEMTKPKPKKAGVQKQTLRMSIHCWYIFCYCQSPGSSTLENSCPNCFPCLLDVDRRLGLKNKNSVNDNSAVIEKTTLNKINRYGVQVVTQWWTAFLLVLHGDVNKVNP